MIILVGVKPLERRFISVRQQRTIQLLVERGSVPLDTVHQALGTGSRSYDYEGFTLEISVQSDFSIRPGKLQPGRPGYVAVVRIFQAASTLAVFSRCALAKPAAEPSRRRPTRLWADTAQRARSLMTCSAMTGIDHGSAGERSTG